MARRTTENRSHDRKAILEIDDYQEPRDVASIKTLTIYIVASREQSRSPRWQNE
jgi:hypothetical protein